MLLHKNPGQTSFQALGAVKKVFGSQVGHTGTLDKFAEGLLIVLTGKMTRFVNVVTDLDKRYRAVIHFGQETSTLDPEGPVTANGPVPEIGQLHQAVVALTGEIDQIPPQYSAIHVAGKRAYERALAGEEVALQPRKITIHSLEILNWEAPRLEILVHCSKGTYIRSLARDLARQCGTVAHLVSLSRLSVGPFSDPVLPDVESQAPPWTSLDPVDFLTKLSLPLIKVPVDQIPWIKNGKPLSPLHLNLPAPDQGTFVLFEDTHGILAVISKNHQELRYNFVF